MLHVEGHHKMEWNQKFVLNVAKHLEEKNMGINHIAQNNVIWTAKEYLTIESLNISNDYYIQLN